MDTPNDMQSETPEAIEFNRRIYKMFERYTVNSAITRWVCTALYEDQAIRNSDLTRQTRQIRSVLYWNRATRNSELVQIISFVKRYMDTKT